MAASDQDMPKHHLKGGGLAAWSIHHPIGVVMISLAVMVVGVFSLQGLAVDLLPKIIYPNVRVRISDPGVAAKIMEDRVTRQLEEQLAITEDVISIQSRTTEGATRVDLAFQYGKDIDLALRDASTRLDRAKRFLPATIHPPTIYKLDPSQIAIAEFVVASPMRSPVALRDWVEQVFSKWFINLPGVAAVEVGGGLLREIHVLPDPLRLAGLGLNSNDIVEALRAGNVEAAAGRLETGLHEYTGRTAGRFTSVAQIGQLPVKLPGKGFVHLADIAEIIDSHQDERIRVRLNGQAGVKISIQKQPSANTVAVVDVVRGRIDWLRSHELIPKDLSLQTVSDQSVYINNALRNAATAAASGALLAMLVVYLFLGNLRRTLIVGTAIPISILVAFAIMGLGGLTLNIMSLGGLALGVGMVVDSTIVMLENIYRHQRQGDVWYVAGQTAAAEVNSAIVASTSTNLAAVIPFLFISGLVGLLFKELIFTITAAIFAAMIVALTLVPALACRVRVVEAGRMRTAIDANMEWLQQKYAAGLHRLLNHRWIKLMVVTGLVVLLALSVPVFTSGEQIFLPSMDDGRIRISVTADPGIALDQMDAAVQKLEQLFQHHPEVETVFTIVGGRIFGRSQRETSNKSSLTVQLKPLDRRPISSEQWIKGMQRQIARKQLAGIKVRMRTGRIRGVRSSGGSDDITLRVTGPKLETMNEIGYRIVHRLKEIEGLRNIVHSAEETRHELVLNIDRDRIAELGLTVAEVAQAVHISLEGVKATDYLENDRSYDIRVRLSKSIVNTIPGLESILISGGGTDQRPVYVADVARVELVSAAAEILRDNQRRIIEVTASIKADAALGAVSAEVQRRLADMPVPDGYSIYDAGAIQDLQEGQRLTLSLLGLALFLVFVVMAVQYESLRNPLIILLCVPFTAVGVAAGVVVLKLPISMPVWLGMIMLAGIVVNNAIVLVEYIEILRGRAMALREAVIEAGRVRLRPVLMTTLTTVFGLLPLGIGLGEGAEMLQPLAITIVFGLTFSMLVTLLLIPVIYCALHGSRSGTPLRSLGHDSVEPKLIS